MKTLCAILLLAPSLAWSASVNLTWTDASVAGNKATSFIVCRQDAVNGPYNDMATRPTAPTYADATVKNGATYSYKVKAVNANGASGYSNEFKTTVPAAAPTPPNAPTNLTGTTAATMGVTREATETEEQPHAAPAEATEEPTTVTTPPTPATGE